MPTESLIELLIGRAAVAGWIALALFAGLRPMRAAVGGAVREAAGGPAVSAVAELWGMVALVVGAFLVRTLFARPAALLSTFNDVEHLVDAMCLAGRSQVCELTHAYPTAVTGLHGAFVRFFGPSLELTYVVNAALSALTVPIAWLLGALWLGRRSAAWWAALCLAVLPLAVRFAATGALVTGFVFLGALALALLTVALRTGATLPLWGAAVAGSLALHARVEGPALLLVALLVAAADADRVRERLRERRYRWHLAGAAGLVLFAVAPSVVLLLGPHADVGGGGWSRLVSRLAASAGVVAAYGVVGWALARRAVPNRLRAPAAVAVAVGLFVALGLAGVPLARWVDPSRWPAFAGLGLDVPTWAEVSWPIVNPHAVPPPLLALLFGGIAVGLVRRRPAALVAGAWIALFGAIAAQKNTGAIPFEGLRTAVSGVVPFSLIVALGADGVFDVARGRRARLLVAGLLGVMLVSSLVWARAFLTDGGYNNQRQLDFLARVVPTLPADAIVVYPDGGADGVADGEHDRRPGPPFARLFRIRTVWWAHGRVAGVVRRDRFVAVSSALAEQETLRQLIEAGRPVLFWEGLACRRTGAPEVLVRPECAAVHRQFRMRPLATETFDNRPFEWDWFDRYLIHGDEVTLTVWQIEGLKDVP